MSAGASEDRAGWVWFVACLALGFLLLFSVTRAAQKYEQLTVQQTQEPK